MPFGIILGKLNTYQIKASDTAFPRRTGHLILGGLLSDDNTRPDNAPCNRFGLLLRDRSEKICD
jgi:hypothetical protein